MDTAMLQEIFEARRRIDAGMQADLVAWRRGLLSIDEVLGRGLSRQFERRWLSLRIGLAGKATPPSTSSGRSFDRPFDRLRMHSGCTSHVAYR